MTDSDGVTDLVRQHWNGRADTFDDRPHHGIHDDEQRARWLSVLGEWVGDRPGDVLDLGCGTGVLSLLLAERGHEVTGIDLAPAMLARARRKAGERDASIEFCRGDATELAVADDAVDAVTARHLLWTLPDPDAAIREWRRVVGPGGRVVLFEGVWNHEEPWEEYRDAHEALPLFDGLSPDDLTARLDRAGFTDVEHAPLQDPVLWGRDPRHEYYVVAASVPA